MKAEVHIEKKFVTDNGKIIRIGNKIKFVAYDVTIEEDCSYEGTVVDIFDNYFVLDECKINGKRTYGKFSIAYHSVEENSCKFIID